MPKGFFMEMPFFVGVFVLSLIESGSSNEGSRRLFYKRD